MSGIKYLLDTNILIGLARDSEEVISLLKFLDLDLENCSISVISKMEFLGYPKLSDVEFSSLEQFLLKFKIISFDADVERHTIAIRREFRLKLPDAINAGFAISGGFTLLTLDKELQRVLGEYSKKINV